MDAARHARPRTRRELHNWVAAYLGIRLAWRKVCRGHTPPFDSLAHWFFDRPGMAFLHGPRGGGKSFLSAIDTHLASRFNPRHETRILGGSKAQSAQVYRALKDFASPDSGDGPRVGGDSDQIRSLLKEECTYHNGSAVSILAASEKSVRGPHVPTLRLDEVDEIDDEIRQAAMGMAMSRRGVPSTVVMTSTWHRLTGPVTDLIARADAGAFRMDRFCAFDVLEHCPEDRSGPWVGGEAGYANCPACPIKRWCHAERPINGDVPLAKLAGGHYAIDTLIDKVAGVSLRVFESDYLCLGPKAAGLWFTGFARATHVRDAAEYDPALPVHLAIDSGVCTGAVLFQVGAMPSGSARINVFADYYAEGLPAEANARALIALAGSTCRGRLAVLTTDPAGGARNPIGPTVVGEYERAGLRPLRHWPVRPVADGLALLEAFLATADGAVGLAIHPRCTRLISAFEGYARKRLRNQWQDCPVDPQHPHEDLIDSLRGGLVAAFPEGRKPQPSFARVHGRNVF